MEIGRTIVYEKSTGEILFDTGERKGLVKEVPIKNFFAMNENTMETLSLPYGYKREEYRNQGSCKVDIQNKTLIIYPKVVVNSNKQEILADGIDTAVITAETEGEAECIFEVADNQFNFQTQNGKASIEITTEIEGELFIVVRAGKYGSNRVLLKGVNPNV